MHGDSEEGWVRGERERQKESALLGANWRVDTRAKPEDRVREGQFQNTKPDKAGP